MKKVAHFQKTTSFITAQDIVHVLILITLSLLLILIPVRGFGQTTPEPPENGGFPALDSVFDSEIPKVPTPSTEPAPTADLSSPAEFPPPAAAPIAPQTPKTFDPASETPTIDQLQDVAPSNAAPLDTAALNPPPQEAPLPSEATPMPPTARQFSTVQVAPLRQPIQQNTRLDTIISSEHPFRQYWGMPNDPQTIITGKPMTVAELFTGTRSAAVRCQLLQAYWELSGLLAVYHFRGETERQAGSAVGTQQTDLITLLREQRRTAEAEFVKQQWVLAELLKQYKGLVLSESELPIPSDFPLYPRYQTHADKIARTERTQYLGRMIPIQEQLIETKNGLWKAASEMMPSASQPFFVVSDQRTTAFLELTSAMVEYNKMIAEYALETIPSNVSQQQILGAVVRLQEKGSSNTMSEQPQSSVKPAGEITLTGYETPAGVRSQSMRQMPNRY